MGSKADLGHKSDVPVIEAIAVNCLTSTAADMSKEFEELEMAASNCTDFGLLQTTEVLGQGDGMADGMAATTKCRKKGGRRSAMDARLDPNIDPKRAARIMANRCVVLLTYRNE